MFRILVIIAFASFININISLADNNRENEWVEQLKENMNILLNDSLLITSHAGICIYDLDADSMIWSYNGKQRMRPASTMKIITAVTALKELGDAHRFKTELYYDGNINNNILNGNIYIKGGFDPRFGFDDIISFAMSAKQLNIDSISGYVYADISMKDTLKWGPGWCWDDDMPVLSPLLFRGKENFINVFVDILKENGINVNKEGYGITPDNAIKIDSRYHSMNQILVRMMKESDNLYAEAMYYQLAYLTNTTFTDRKDINVFINKIISDLGFNPDNYIVADGSGVSLYNYLSPELITYFLKYAYSHENIYSHLYESLPVSGKDGTLKKRMRKSNAYKKVRAKTGTLEGVISLAGYAQGGNGHNLAFCIINQGVSKSKLAREFQDKVCELLCR